MRYPLARPLVGNEELSALAAVLESGFLVQGPMVERFEKGIAEVAGLAHGVACSSGTAALHLALKVLGVGPGHEVLVPAFGFPATANAVKLLGGTVRFVDIDPETLCPTLSTLEAAMHAGVRGFIAVHSFGLPVPVDAYAKFCERHGLFFLQDAACALGTRPESGWADPRFMTCLSFHPRKTLTTGEGGMVLCQDPGQARELRMYRNHGIDPLATGWSRFEVAGFNYRLTDLAAAIGVAQLGRLEALVAKRRLIATWYRKHLAGADCVDWPSGFDADGLATQSVIIRVSDDCDRDKVMEELLAEGIQTTLAGYAICEQPVYIRDGAAAGSAFPHTRRLFRQGLALPLTDDLCEDDVAHICHTLKRISAHARGNHAL